MGGISRFFKKEDRWNNLHNFLSSSFLKVKYDLQHIYSWVNYFKQKHEHNDYQHEVLTNQLREHRKSIVYLNQELEGLKNQLKFAETTGEQQKGQLRTLQRTSQGQVLGEKGQLQGRKSPNY